MAIAPSFFNLPRSQGRRRGAQVAIFGCPADIGGVPGTAEAPEFLRKLSGNDYMRGWFRRAKVRDVGDACENNDSAMTDIVKFRPKIGGGFPFAFGGNHAVTLPLLALARERVCLPLHFIQFDAHPDTGDGGPQKKFTHATFVSHAVNKRLISPRSSVQVGVRCNGPALGMTRISSAEVHLQGPAAVAEKIHSVVGPLPVYLSFDIDALDPVFAPGVECPLVGGMHGWQALEILRLLRGINLVGADVVEYSPARDDARSNTGMLCLAVAREIIRLAI